MSLNVVMLHAVLVVGDGTTSFIDTMFCTSVARDVLRIKKLPVAIVGASGVIHCNGERTGEVESWNSGCALQVPHSACWTS